MNGRFSYCNPTKLYFGEGSLSNLKTELGKYGKTVMLVYDKEKRNIRQGNEYT